jgi:hypothetical protein
MYVQNSKGAVVVHNYTVDPVPLERVRDPRGKYSVEYPMGKSAHKDEILEEASKADNVKVGQMVSWSTFGSRARGKVERIVRDGKINVPDSSFEITGTEEDPAALIRIYRDNEPTDTLVGHKVSTLRVLDSMSKAVKTEDGIEYPASAFAYVPDETKPSTWKLRLWDDLESKETPAQVSRAIQAITTGFRGNKAEIPLEDMPKVISAIRTAWNKVHTAADEKPDILKKLEKSLGF